jgi:membrane fusion protein (multidrug efflux system)
VEVTQVVQQDVPITKEWVATLTGLVNADIRAQVSGYLIKQNYLNGAFVRKGALLFQIDPRSFQATLDQAKANLDQTKGTLKQAKATLEEAKANQQRAEAGLGKTKIDVARYTPLAKVSVISQQELDDAIQANLAAKAQVEAMKAAVGTAMAAIETNTAAIAAAQAAVDTAQLNLGFTRIVSLIDGVAGIANAQVGDLVGPQTTTPLVTVSTTNPILAQFAPSEQEYLSAMRRPGTSTAEDQAALRRLKFELVLADGTVYPLAGNLYAVNREVEARTGSITVQVQFPNPNNVLRPGGFGGIKSVVWVQHHALLVPQRCLSELQGTYLVALVGDDNKVILRQVKAGQKVGSMWVVEDGLKPGERVVADGVQKLREGMKVNPKPYHAGIGECRPMSDFGKVLAPISRNTGRL